MRKECCGAGAPLGVGVDGDPDRDELAPGVALRADAGIVARAFGETANPDEYVARSACEDALRGLERSIFEQGEPAALIAPPGMGKSLLLRVFARRTADRADSIELAGRAMSFEELCEWTLRLFGEPVGDLPSADLERVLASRDLLVTIDDASSLPVDTARALGAFAKRVAPRLHIAFAASDGYAASRMLAAFGEPVNQLRLSQPMNADEIFRYMAERLKRWGASSEMIDLLKPGSIARVLRLSGGVPRRLHLAAGRVLGARLAGWEPTG